MPDAFRRENDPGLPPLRTDRLALAMRDMQIRGQPYRCALDYIGAAIGWAVIVLLVWLALVVL
jgi:hypothetical protein